MDVDTALAKVGGYRRWHLAIFSFLGIFGFMPLCWQGIIIIFLGKQLASISVFWLILHM